MKKNVILLTILILVAVLSLSACFVPPPEGDTTQPSGNPSESQNPDNTPPKPKTAKEAIELFLSSIENNFSASAEIKNNLGELLKGGQKYSIAVDGSKIWTDNNGEIYFVEKAPDGSEYVYLQQGDGWHKRLITEDDNYPSDMSMVTDLLDNVTWKSYSAAANFAEGEFEHEGNDMWIECEMRSDGATVSIYQIQHWLLFDTRLSVGSIEIYNLGSTTVRLPTSFIEE